jgi:hypothetical protein
MSYLQSRKSSTLKKTGALNTLQDSQKSEEKAMMAMLNRMMRGDAEYPHGVSSHLSSSCLDMLRRIIQPDSKQRINIQQIMQHAWFLEVSHTCL